MSFGAGHVQDMNNRLKQNRANKPSNRAKFKENNREGIYSKKQQTDKIKFHQVPKEKLERIKEAIRIKSKSEKLKQIKILVISLIITVIMMIAVFSF
ncbi:hypothetical protein ML462_15595 [Gramella lutea]|uniref:Uncharacterized protein n=1 Tax=Christiangramia lutea TaxID=1607951 RepID=A0A9X1V4T1_9FLAO|nr:hypothetical protein [Christiangramia lutea]MCH4824597.1 hypothetical protein [Christiangramia lutea]